MDADLDTLAAALYVRTDDLLNDSPSRISWRPRWPSAPVVWGGDWNHELSGRISAGSKIGREAILRVVEERGLQVPTVVLGSEHGFGSVNHIAVPDDWKVLSAERHVASSGGKRLSDHDAYVVEIEDRPGPTTVSRGRRESQPASLEAAE